MGIVWANGRTGRTEIGRIWVRFQWYSNKTAHMVLIMACDGFHSPHGDDGANISNVYSLCKWSRYHAINNNLPFTSSPVLVYTAVDAAENFPPISSDIRLANFVLWGVLLHKLYRQEIRDIYHIKV